MNSKHVSQAKILDQFYTKSDVAKSFVKAVDSVINFESYDYILEPCVGEGAIFNELPSDKRVGFDIDPKIDVTKQNFLSYSNSLPGNILVITNPPYGVQSKLAIQFFNKAIEFSNTIALIVPIQWKRFSLQRRLPVDFKLIFTEDLPKKSFIFEGVEYGVSTCMQIWSRDFNLPDLRTRETPVKRHPDFTFMQSREESDFLLIVCGRRSTYIHEIDSRVSDYTVERIKVNTPEVRSIFESINWDRYGEQSTGTMWINREMIVREYIEEKNKVGRLK